MGSLKSVLDFTSRQGTLLSMHDYVIASPEHVARLGERLARKGHPATRLQAAAGDEPIPAETIAAARVLVLEVAPSSEQSLARIAQVRQMRPALPVIAAIENADFALTRLLVRQGVFDVVALPFDAEELQSRILDATATLAGSADAGLAPMVAVAAPLGGSGATTIVTHLAAAIAKDPNCPRRCCIVDLDLQFGDVANYLGVSPTTSVLDLLEAGERLDGELIRNAAVETGRGPFVLAAPAAISPLEQVDVDSLLRLLELARREFGFVLLDLPANWTNWTLSAVVACSETMLLTDQTLNGLRQTKRCLELLESVDIPRSDIGIVVNRSEKRFLQKIGTDDVANALNREVKATLAREKSGLSEAQDQGLLLSQVSRKARFSEDIATLASQLCEQARARA